MKNINFDNPYLLLLAIPFILAIIVPFFIVRNKDNKTVLWTASVITHIVIIIAVCLAVAGLSSETVLTKTTVYVVADVSYSSDRNLDKIDEYINEINASLPENSKLGVVCFGKNYVHLTQAGRKLKSVSEAKVDKSATDIVKALNYTESLFKDDSLKRIVLITDGNDTANNSSGSIASTVERITENGIRVDAIFLDNTLNKEQSEIQLLAPEFTSSTYIGAENELKLLVQASKNMSLTLELYSRPFVEGGDEEFILLKSTVLTAEAGLNPVTIQLPTVESGAFEYKATVSSKDDHSEFNNTRTFTQTIVGEERILLLTGSMTDKSYIEGVYRDKAEIDSYVITSSGTRVPFTIEDLVTYDEIIISNLDIRNIRNANAFVDTLDIVISQYGKSLVTMGDLELQTNKDDPLFKKFQELLPVNYGSLGRDGKLYTILLDISHSMYMASKLTTAKQAAIQLISVLEEDDYVCLITFSGDVKVQTPKRVKDCKEQLNSYIMGLTSENGTDIGLGLEEALKTVRALNLVENQIMMISDGFSFESKVIAADVTRDLVQEGAVVSAINIYIPSDGNGETHHGYNTLKGLVDLNTSGKGKCYKLSRPEDVSGLIFGTVAEDVGDVIIEKDAQINIVKPKDKVAVGFYGSMPYVSKFIVSLEKYDATVPLTITYKKPNGYQETVPLYTYRAHGNGKVSSFTSSLTSNRWTGHFSADERERLLENIFVGNTPSQRIDRPFTVNLERTDYDAYIEIVPSILDYTATVQLRITNPNGKTVKRALNFDSKKYSYSMLTQYAGTYRIEIIYSYEGHEFIHTESFEIPFLPEYDAFAVFDRFKLYEFMRDNGTVTVDGIPSLENNKEDITTYRVSYVIPLLIFAVALFVADVLIRKLKFKKKGKKIATVA